MHTKVCVPLSPLLHYIYSQMVQSKAPRVCTWLMLAK